jgi:hypothetical protein
MPRLRNRVGQAHGMIAGCGQLPGIRGDAQRLQSMNTR